MVKAPTHKWTFRGRFRRHAYGWKSQPTIMRVVFKDSGFACDVVKTNASQILKQAGINDLKSL